MAQDKTILDETQAERDAELAEYLGITVDEVVASWDLTDNELRAGPVIWDGHDLEADSYDYLYERPLFSGNLAGALRAFTMFIVKKRGWMVRRAKDLAGGFENKCVLDLGCGVGSHGIYALERGASEVHFLDVDGPTRAYARWRVERRGLMDRAVFLGPGDKLKPKLYGVSLLIDVLEHLADPIGVFKRVMKATRPKAVVALQFGFGGDARRGHFEQSRREWMKGKAGLTVLHNLVPVERFFYFRRMN